MRLRTRGDRHHPQLVRFQAHPNPVACLECYPGATYDEAIRNVDRPDPHPLFRIVPGAARDWERT